MKDDAASMNDQKRPLVILTQGLPASGKSTQAKDLASITGATIVCLDNIREMMSGVTGSKNVHADWDSTREQIAIKIMLESIKALVRDGKNVVVANCHMTKRLPNAIKIAAHEGGGADFGVLRLNVDIEECIRRDALRGINSVGEDVIRRLAKSNKGWVLTSEYMNDMPEIVPVGDPMPGKRWAILCDLDGTLAIHQPGTNPYANERILTDSLNHAVATNLFRAMHEGDRIIILTAREDNEECRNNTLTWLAENDILYDDLIMRQLGDKRSDHIVKLDLFNEHIRNQYNVRNVFDDRNRVVSLWRQLGVPTWQVNPGDF